MPAPTRPAPVRTEPTALAVPKGIVGYYTDAETDALLAALQTGGGPAPDLSAYATVKYVDDALAALPADAVTVHDGSYPVPLSGDPTPQELDDAFSVLPNGLHYYPAGGSLVSVLRGEHQTTITITGPVKSVAQIVKSSAGLPTPENPSMIITQAADGRWAKVIGTSLDQPFGDPQMVDIFALVNSGELTALSAYYTRLEVDALLAALQTGGGGGLQAVDLSAYATTAYVDGKLATVYTKAEVDAAIASAATGGTVDLTNYYTKTELDTAFSENDLAHQSLETLVRDVALQSGERIDLKADQATTYTKTEVDAAIAGIVTGDLSQEQIDAIISQVGPVDLTAYAKSEDVYAKTESDTKYATKEATTLLVSQVQAIFDSIYTRPEADDRYAAKSDNTQNVVANGLVAKGYTFGDSVSESNPGLVYTDTGEGYGPRLVLGTPAGNELIPYQSDFAPIRSRLDALESKAAPGSGVQDVTALATKESVDLLRSQLQAIFDGMYTRPEADARFVLKSEMGVVYATKTDLHEYVNAKTYTKDQADAKFLTLVDIGILVQKGELSEYAKTVYTKPEIDSKLATLNPTAAPSINDPALADFKASVLDEVRKMMAGGKTIPADVPWTKLLNTGSTVAEAKVLNGVVYLRGIITKGIGAGYIANVSQLPPTIPPPPGGEWVIPLACKNTSPAGRHFGYATFQPNRQIGVSCDSALNTVWLDGISYPAYD